MSFKLAETTVSSAVATSGTFTVSYPEGTAAGTYAGGNKHTAWVDTHQYLYTSEAGEISLSFGASNITVTYNGSTTIAAGSRVHVQLDILGSNDTAPGAFELPFNTVAVDTYMIDLGAPDIADANGYVESQDLTSAGVFSVDTTAAAAIAAAALEGVADVPRNVVAAWTGTGVLTITGTDVYGNVVVESSASGTSLTGKKAFKTVTGISSSANITALTVGTGDVLGLPVYVANSAYILAELEDGATATAGTLVVGSTATPTATTGDVRGTYDPNSAADGTKAFKLLAILPDPENRGIDQYAG